MKLYNFGGWLIFGLTLLGLSMLRHQPAPVRSPLAAQIDTTTYGDARIVYKLATDTARNSNGDLRRLPDLTNAPVGARWRVIWKPSTFDSVMLVTGDTFALSPMDSADATALATSWGVTDPHTVDLAWHEAPGEARDPLENVTVVAVHDTLRTSWTSTSDSVRIFSGLNAGGQEDTFFVAGSSTPHDRVVSVEGSFYSCGNAYSTQAAADYAENQCGSATIDTAESGGGGDWANEPAGYTQITDRSFDTHDEDGWSDNEGSPDYSVPVTEAGAPTSPSNVGRVEFDDDEFTVGGAQCNRCAERVINGTGSLFFAFTFKVSNNWYGHDASAVNKIIFITDNSYGGGGDPAFLSAQGSGNSNLHLQVRLQGPGTEHAQGIASGNLGSNLASAQIVRDTWYEIEVAFVANTGDNFDGEAHVWVNGTKTHEYTDVKFFDESADPSNHQFDNVRWGPVYGGVGGNFPQNGTQWQYIDHFYISGP